MLPKSDVFVTLGNDGASMDKRDKHWSVIIHGDGSAGGGIQTGRCNRVTTTIYGMRTHSARDSSTLTLGLHR
jgi:hypothetical protein